MRKILTSLLLASASISSAYALPLAQPAIVEMQTDIGTITIQLNWDKAPISSQNFTDYVNSGFYKDTYFHRVVKDVQAVVQGGGFDAKTITQKTPKATIINEANNGLKNVLGTISMARTPEPNSATSQFFFNTMDNSSFFDFKDSENPGYAVFGEVINNSMNIVTKIGNFSLVGAVPYSKVYDCGFNFCAAKIIIENVYTSQAVDTINSITRVSVNGSGKVTTSIPKSFSCTSTSKSCTLTKPFGTAISLIAVPSTGYFLKGWSGDCSGVTAILQLNTATKNNNCTATFIKKGSF